MRILDKEKVRKSAGRMWTAFLRAARFTALVLLFAGVAFIGGVAGGLFVTDRSDDNGPELTRLQRNWNATVAIVTPTGMTAGTGVIISRQGHVLTAAHVIDDVEDGETVRVAIDGTILEKTYDAEVVASDPLRDLAILRLPIGYPSPALIETRDVPPFPGDSIYSIGFPGELRSDKTVNTGEVRAISWIPPYGPGFLPQSIDTMLMNGRLEPGYSGAGIFLQRGGRLTGLYIIEIWTIGHLLPRQSPIAVPVRRIRPFLDENRVPYNDPGPSWWDLQWRRLSSQFNRLTD